MSEWKYVAGLLDPTIDLEELDAIVRIAVTTPETVAQDDDPLVTRCIQRCCDNGCCQTYIVIIGGSVLACLRCKAKVTWLGRSLTLTEMFQHVDTEKPDIVRPDHRDKAGWN